MPRGSPVSLASALLLAGTLAGDPLAAAPQYSVGFGNQADVFSADPFERDSSYALPPSNGTGTTSVYGKAMAGRVGATQHMEMIWTGGSGAFSSSAHARARTDDFIITGPPGATTVAATLNLRLKSTHDLAGGYTGHGGHASGVAVLVQVAQAFWPFGSYGQVSGDYRYTNGGTFASGVLTGVGGSTTNFPFTLSATLPVNVPFAVYLHVEANGTAYGNFSTNPGSVVSDAGSPIAGPLDTGLMLDAVNGQVITMPAGYTLNAPSWGITDNVVGVGDDSPRSRMRLSNAGANPFTHEARVSLDLPRPGRVRVAVFGVTGRRVRTLGDEWMPAGRRDLVWDGRGADGRAVRAGLYFVRAEHEGERADLRMVRVP
jgi:hypothetical protein